MRHRNKGVRKLCECQRRNWARCSHPWYFNFKWEGVAYRFSLDKHLKKHIETKEDAEDEARELRKQIKDGKFGQPAAVADMTLQQLSDAYVARYVDMYHAATRDEFVYALKTIC